ncbi:MAG: hypothetical protein GWP27_06850 [Bacteroidetes bacterium]|nr:hypothetical protein [Bacteroidota bacterium]
MNARQQQILFLTVMAPAVIYVFCRAAILDFTYDECWTFLGYASGNLGHIITNIPYPAANNHVLHSLLMYAMRLLFGNEEFFLRLPVVLSMIPFGFYAFQVMKRLSPTSAWLGLIVLIYQPYLLDYFVLARGYGIALAALMFSWHFFLKYVEEGQSRDRILSIVGGIIAAWANFTFLLPYLIVIGLIGLVNVLKDKSWDKHFWRDVAIAILVPILLFSLPIYQLIEANELYYGGVKSFYEDTLTSVAYSISYHNLPGTYLAPLLLAILLSAIPFVRLLRGQLMKADSLTALIPIAIGIASILQHHLLDSPYLIDRTAIMLIPFMVFSVVIIHGRSKHPWMRRMGILCILVATGLNFGLAFNLSHTVDFKEYADVKSAMKLIEESIETDEPITIGKSVYLNAPINFYAQEMNNLAVNASGLDYCAESPVYLLFERDTVCVAEKNVVLLKRFETSGLHVYKSESLPL